MPEAVYDKTYPGGLHLLEGRTVDANGVPLDAPPGAAPIGITGADDAARAAADAAAVERAAQWAESQAEEAEALYGEEIAAALDTSVADLDDYLETITDTAAIEAMAAADQRTTAAAHYTARLAALTA